MAAYLRRKAITPPPLPLSGCRGDPGRLAIHRAAVLVLPVRQTLGAVLLQAGKPAEAEGMFREALRQHPNSAWALFGQEAQREQGDAAAAAAAQRQLDALWEGNRRRITLSML